MGESDLDSFLETVSSDWLGQEQSAQVFFSHLKWQRFHEFRRAISPLKAVTKRIENIIEKSSKTRGYFFRNPCFINNGLLLPHHRTVSSEISFEENPEQGAKDCRTLISGSGDGFSEKDAKTYALLELVERISYTLGKYQFGFTKGLFFDTQGTSSLLGQPVSPPSTSGFALESTPFGAIMRASQEALERDAFLCHWYTQIAPPIIDLSDHPVYRLILRKAKSLGLELRAYRLKAWSSRFYVIYLVAFDPEFRHGVSYFCSGLGTAMTRNQAFLKAYFEMDRFLGINNQFILAKKKGHENIDSPLGRFFYYQAPLRFADLKVFTTEENLEIQNCDSNGSSENSFSLSRDLPALPAVYPGPIHKKMAGTLFTCWANIPGLLQLDYDRPPMINEQRLQEFSEGRPFALNLAPHPLP